MIDLLLLRQNREVIVDSQKKRFKSVEIVDKCAELDEIWRLSNIIIFNIL